MAEQIWIVRIGLILEIRNNKCNQIGRYERGLGEACGGGAILRATFEFDISISKYKLIRNYSKWTNIHFSTLVSGIFDMALKRAP